jgi:LysM repeat protein
MIDGLQRALVVSNTNQAALLGLKNLRTISVAKFKGYAKTSKITGLKFFCDGSYFVSITGSFYPVSETDASHYPGRGITLDALTCAAITKSSTTLGRFVRSATKQYFLIEGQVKRPIANVAALKKLRGTGPKAVLVGPYFLSLIPTGKAAGSTMSVEPLDAQPPIVLPEPNVKPVPTPSASPSPSSSPKPSASPKPSTSPSPTASPSVKPKTYTVVPGDYLNKIAAKFGVTTTALMTANKITNANSIQVGQILIIP